MVIEAVTGILGGKKSKKAAKKQKRLAIQQNVLSRKVMEEARIQQGLSEEEFELQKAAVREQRRQDRIGTIREARIRRASILSSAQASGMGQGSSGVVGAVGALQSQFASTLGLSNVFTRIQDKSADIQSKLLSSQGRVAELQGQSQMLQGQSALVSANLAKQQANIGMWGNVAKLGTDLATAAYAPTRGTQFGSAGFFQAAFGGNKITDTSQ